MFGDGRIFVWEQFEIFKAELQRLKPHYRRRVFVVAKATTHKDLSPDIQTSTSKEPAGRQRYESNGTAKAVP
jgi:hypothetical protein